MPTGSGDQKPGLEIYGVVSLLNARHEGLIWSVWEELDREFGLGIREAHIPHFSYHVAERYDLDSLERILRRRASEATPFRVESKTLGVFRAAQPLFFLPLVPTLELMSFHRSLWSQLSEIASGIEYRYQPDGWVPGIALTPDIDKDLSAELIQFLLRRDLAWEMPVDNIALLHDSGARQELAARFDFRGTSPDAPSL